MNVRHTASAERGQIYVPIVNWTLAAATLGAVIGFGSSEGLAGAYGIAVSLLMAITTFLAALVAIQWGFSLLVVLAVNGFFLVAACEQLRIDGNERSRERAFAEDILQKVWNSKRGAERAGCIGRAQVVRKNSLPDHTNDATDQNPHSDQQCRSPGAFLGFMSRKVSGRFADHVSRLTRCFLCVNMSADIDLIVGVF